MIGKVLAMGLALTVAAPEPVPPATLSLWREVAMERERHEIAKRREILTLPAARQ